MFALCFYMLFIVNAKAEIDYAKTTKTTRNRHNIKSFEKNNNINSGYPAHEPPRMNKLYIYIYIFFFAEVRGLDILYFCLRFFLEAFLLFVCLFSCFFA